MNNAELMQATMLALTRQNVTPRAAPLSTAQISATCVRRNIMPGEPVVITQNPYASATYLGPNPGSNTYWVDDDNRMYYVSDGILHIIDGISGEPLDETTVAYGFKLGTNCCAYKTREDENLWVVILPDGKRTAEIETRRFPDFGNRNGIVCVIANNNSTSNAVDTYDESGNHLRTLSNLTSVFTFFVCPIDMDTVAVLRRTAVGIYEYQYYSYAVVTQSSVVGTSIAIDYDVQQPSAWHNNTISVLGCDQSRFYVEARLVEDGALTDERVLIATTIDNQTAQETIDEYSEARTYSYPSTMLGTTVRSRTAEGETVRDLLDLSTMTVLYSDDIQPVPNAVITENLGYLWIPGSGVWQKAAAGWIMYASSVVPEGFAGKLGYAVHKVLVGKQGRAIILFEGGPDNA